MDDHGTIIIKRVCSRIPGPLAESFDVPGRADSEVCTIERTRIWVEIRRRMTYWRVMVTQDLRTELDPCGNIITTRGKLATVMLPLQ
jgi:hypothetical protein